MVDDDAYIRRIAEIALRKVGKWDVLMASSGKEALAMLANEIPDVILLDVTMPGLDGPATLAELKALDSSSAVPVIFLTGHVMTDEVAAYRKLGVAGVISKPFDPLKLAEDIRRILNAE